jgi:tetratricopeptide (TPR) repeat protein
MQAAHTMPEGKVVMAQANWGVQMLLAGAYHEAVDILATALTDVKTLLAQYDYSSEDVWAQDEPKNFCRFLHPQGDFDNTVYVCRSPIVVNCEVSPTFPILRKLCYSILYNLALTYHLGALATKSSGSVFCKALTCYQMAHDLQPADDLEIGVQLSLSISNNIGHIHAALGNTEKASQCFQHLLSTMMYTNQSGGRYSPFLLDGFMRNVQLFVMKSRTAAAA